MIRMGIVWKSEVSMRKQRRWEFGDRRWLAAEISGQPQAPSGVEGRSVCENSVDGSLEIGDGAESKDSQFNVQRSEFNVQSQTESLVRSPESKSVVEG